MEREEILGRKEFTEQILKILSHSINSSLSYLGVLGVLGGSGSCEYRIVNFFPKNYLNMPVQISFSDKVFAGVNHSFTITSNEGVPSGEVLVDGKTIPHRLIPQREPKWKISFSVPPGAAGKELVVRIRAGASTIEEKKTIVAG